MKKIVAFIIWFVLSMALLTTSLRCITEPNTMSNIVGMIGLVVILIFSVTTKCLTNFNFKRKHEE